LADETYVYHVLIPKMTAIIIMSFDAVSHKLAGEKSGSTFEIFGYDFFIDADLGVWLIEANTNPCLEESSKLLENLLPRMMNDALKLSLDVMFPKGACDEG